MKRFFSACLIVAFLFAFGSTVSAAYPSVLSAEFNNNFSSTWGAFTRDANSSYGGSCVSSTDTITSSSSYVDFRTSVSFTAGEGYSYKRFKSPLNYDTPLGTNTGVVTIDLSLCFLNLPELENDTDEKVGQTGFIINIRMAETNKEFYICFAEYYDAERNTNTLVTSYTGDRASLSPSSLSKAYLLLDVQDEPQFHKYTFRYDPGADSDKRITMYVDGTEKATFPEPTSRSTSHNCDFAYFTLVNRQFASSESTSKTRTNRVKMNYLHIYNSLSAYTDTALSVPLYGQTKSNTCSCATQKMLFEYFGLTLSEAEIEEQARKIANDLCGNAEQFGSSEVVEASIQNTLPKTAGNYKAYDVYDLMSSPTVDSENGDYRFLHKITENIDHGKPVALLLNTSSSPGQFGYSTPGHWVLVRGYYYDQATSRYMLQICDPADGDNDWSETDGRYADIEYSAIRYYSYKHSGTMICPY